MEALVQRVLGRPSSAGARFNNCHQLADDFGTFPRKFVTVDGGNILHLSLGGKDQLGWHNFVFEDFLFVVNVADEQVEGRDALLETPLDNFPLAVFDNAGQDIERPDLLRARLVAVDVEGNAHVAKRNVGRLLALLKLAVGGRIEKIRHYVDVQGHTFEVDEFLGDNAGLVVAELELDDADASYPRPDWLGVEVTDQPRYYNLALASRPFSTW